MKKVGGFISVMVILLAAVLVYAKPSFVQSPPLTQAVSTSVGNVKSGGPVQVPLITWGGDIATIVANGNQKNTAKGSIFAQQGLNLKLVREDDFKVQVQNYLSGKSPYLRGTMGMINMAAEVVSNDPRSKPVVIYQMTWSTGGDAMVVKSNIKDPSDLRGKTIAVQVYGPHVDYLAKILADAGMSMKDIKIKWVNDLTGTDNTPMAAFYESDVDAAMVIIPDALALTSNGTVGTGAEDSVKGASIMLSTKTANRIISDVYAVRSDYFQANQAQVQKFVHGLMLGQESLANLVRNKKKQGAQYQQMISASADILLDSPQAVADAEGLYADCQYVGWKGNVKFFGDVNYPRGFDKLTNEIQTAYITFGLLGKKVSLTQAKWDYNKFKSGLTDTDGVEAPRFNREEVAKVVTRRQQQDTMDEGVLFSFEVYFQPNQNTFPAEQYEDAFKRVIELSSTYGGAIITVEGHSDPLGYLKKVKSGQPQVVLNQTKQAAKNLSMTRANAVRDSLISYAKTQSVTLDDSQFTSIGWGIDKPKSGKCGDNPCPPKTEQEWRNNMRVEFKIIQIEAEESVFQPLD